MSVRAKFKVSEVKDTGYTIQVRAFPVYSTNPEDENRKFWNATPSGDLRLDITNKDAASQFVVDTEYYVDFTPVPRQDN